VIEFLLSKLDDLEATASDLTVSIIELRGVIDHLRS
jgi:hypothetical protein